MEYINLLLIIAVIITQIVLILIVKRSKGLDERQAEEIIRKAVKELREDIDGKIDRLKDSQQNLINELKDSLSRNISESRKEQQDNINNFSRNMTDSLDSQSKKLSELTANNTTGMDNIRNKVEERLDKIQGELKYALESLQKSNAEKLDDMRKVVDEKLEKTLETRLQKSFETVSMQLENVNKGLGEMQNVAKSVGSLNQMLANNKSRGILGELQLGQIIEDMLPSQLYDREVPTIKGSSEHVEYAIKLPGVEDGKHVYLPIDSKFPLESYYSLLDGYEKGDTDLVNTSRKALYARIKSFAKDVKTKYVSPPDTTNFAVIFLPTEGLYAEVARDSSFFDSLRQDGIIITGPTTISAMLNSLQIGFKTLQIQKGAANIEKTLGIVKKEFENFEDALNKAQKNITQAGNAIETLVGTRTRAINRSLREVQTYTGDDDTQKLLETSDNGDNSDNEEYQ